MRITRRGSALAALCTVLLAGGTLVRRPSHDALATGSCHCGYCTGSPSATCCALKCTTGCGGDHCAMAPTATPVPPHAPPTPTPVVYAPPTPTPIAVTPATPTPIPHTTERTPTPTPTVPTTTSGSSPQPPGAPPPPDVFFPPQPPYPPPTVSIYGHDPEIVIGLDIHPIQVVQDPPHEIEKEDIPLVEGKATMVRVFVLLPKSMKELKKATCTLTWGDEKFEITADVIRAHDRVWVIPVEPKSDDPTSPTSYEKVVRVLAKKGPLSEVDLKVLKGDYYWGYNFTFDKKGKPCPNKLTLNAKLVAKGATLGDKTEESGKQFKITQFTNKEDVFEAVVAGFACGRIPNELIDPSMRGTKGIELDWRTVEASDFFRKKIAEKAEQYKNELLGVFPIPDKSLTLTVRPFLYHNEMSVYGGFQLGDKYETPGSLSADIESAYPSADTILLVTNKRDTSENHSDTFNYAGEKMYLSTLHAIFDNCECSGWTPIWSGHLHYITCNTQLTALVAAHETGHDTRYLGRGHESESTPPLEDGWDAGAHVGFDTTYQRDALMREVQDKPWILPKEYRKLLKALCSSSDPPLLRVHGVLDPDGKLDLAPPRALMGPAPERGDGAGSLVFADATGKPLLTWPVALREEKSRRGFRADAPIPERARSVTLHLPGDVRRRFAVSGHAPAFEWVDVQATPDGAGLRVRYRASHPDRLPVELHFIYSPDGRRRIDLATPKGAPLAGETVLDIANLPGGRSARLTAWATAGLRLTRSVSFPFSVPDRKPWLWVDEEPEREGAGRYSTTLYDPEDGFDLQPAWRAEDGTSLGSGRHPDGKRLAALRPGRHRLTATVRDSAGNEASASVDTEIKAPRAKW